MGSRIRIHMHVATGLRGCHDKQRHPPHTTSLRHQSCYHHRPIHFKFNLVTTTPRPNLCKCPAPMRLFCHPCCLRLGGSNETMCYGKFFIKPAKQRCRVLTEYEIETFKFENVPPQQSSLFIWHLILRLTSYSRTSIQKHGEETSKRTVKGNRLDRYDAYL